jgi:hypothetical protein
MNEDPLRLKGMQLSSAIGRQETSGAGCSACIEIADFYHFSGTMMRRTLYEEGLTQIMPFQGRITASSGTVTAEGDM